ncbi:hypothetical protein AR465_09085 [Ralstonia solanacearum]|nr:hypothetical protein AR465_09085 [Ralstonia solanacearum]
MDAAYAEHYAAVGEKLDQYAAVMLDCLQKRGEFNELHDWICPRTSGHRLTLELMIPSCA